MPDVNPWVDSVLTRSCGLGNYSRKISKCVKEFMVSDTALTNPKRILIQQSTDFSRYSTYLRLIIYIEI